MIVADCALLTHVQAWLDTNANGQREQSEPPIAGVRFELDELNYMKQNVADDSHSDADGTAIVQKFLPGCPDVKFEIRAVPPAGYELTTQPSVPATKHVKFGFVASKRRRRAA